MIWHGGKARYDTWPGSTNDDGGTYGFVGGGSDDTSGSKETIDRALQSFR